MLTLNQSPTSNTLPVRINLLNNGHVQAVLDPDDAAVVNATVDQVRLINGPHAPVVLNQQTPGVFACNPGDITIIERGVPGGVDVSYAPPGGHAQRVHFQ